MVHTKNYQGSENIPANGIFFIMQVKGEKTKLSLKVKLHLRTKPNGTKTMAVLLINTTADEKY